MGDAADRTRRRARSERKRRDHDTPRRSKLLDAQRGLEKETKRLDEVAWRIARVAEILRQLAAEVATAEDDGAPSPPGVETAVLREEGRTGASHLSVVSNADGSWDVRINGGRTFRLQRQLGALLRSLAEPGGRTDCGGLVGWKSYEQVVAALARETHRPHSRSNVVKMMWRLREAFALASQNAFLLHSSADGVRFALRCNDDA